jgi:hypothetical protein
MFTTNLLNEIKNWFEENGKVEFELPDRYFGRPGDSDTILENIKIEENNLVIRFKNKALRKFVFRGETNYKFIDDCLELSNFELLAFEWQEAEEPIFHSETYDFGSVRFIPHSKYVPPEWTL